MSSQGKSVLRQDTGYGPPPGPTDKDPPTISVGGWRRRAIKDDDIFFGVGQIAQRPPGCQRLADLFLNRRVSGRFEDQIGTPRDISFFDGIVFEEGSDAETGAGRNIVITERSLLIHFFLHRRRLKRGQQVVLISPLCRILLFTPHQDGKWGRG